MSRRLVSIFILIICLSFKILAIKGQNSNKIIAIYGSAPIIDGQLHHTEWNDSSIESLDDDTTFYIKQDGENLYIGFNISDSTNIPEDGIAIYLDIDNDKNTSLQTDDIGVVAYRDGNIVEVNVAGGSWTFTAVSGWSAQVHTASDFYQVEFNITYSKINVTAGNKRTIGMASQRSNNGMSFSAWPPNGFIKTSPETWGYLSSTGYNWVPELPSSIIFLFMLTTLLTLIVIISRKNMKATV